jgi:hypothetical protein
MARGVPRPPKQRAQVALEQATAREAFLADKVKDAETALEKLKTAHRKAEKRLEHAKADPDLNDEDDTPIEGVP